MIIRVWGVVNSTEVEFTPIPNRPGYWEGYAPRLRGHLQCSVMLDYHAHTEARLLGDRMEARLIDAGDRARLLLLPWVAQLVTARDVNVLQENYIAKLKGCRKAVV